MKIVVIGGSGLIGTKLVNRLRSDGHEVVADAHARNFDAELDDHSLTPGDSPRVAGTRFGDWLNRLVQGGATLKHA